MPYSRPTLTELVERTRDDFDARMPGADSRLRRSVLEVLARIHAGAMNGLYGLIDYIWRQVFPDTAEAEHLARWAAIWGKTRKAATPAAGNVIFTGINGTHVPIGTLVVRADGIEYATTQEGMIALGVVTLAVEAVEAGPLGNADAGQTLQIASPVAGVNAAAAIAAGGLRAGAAEEDDDALRGRLLDRIQQPPHGGNRNDYVAWALEVPEVTRAWVYPSELGIGTVSVRFVMDGRADIIPLLADVETVQAHIDAVRPVTAALTVVAPVPVALHFTIRAAPVSAPVQAAIEEELRDLLRREASPGGLIFASHIRESISTAAGEIDHDVIAPIGNVDLGTGSIAIFGSVTFVA